MQLSIPNRALLPRAGPYSHAIVGYGIHWNHLAECTTPARGSCRPSPDICLRISSFCRSSEFSGIGELHLFQVLDGQVSAVNMDVRTSCQSKRVVSTREACPATTVDLPLDEKQLSST